jgi:hypothetical protein
MNVEEQLRKMREPKSVSAKKIGQTKIISLVMLGIGALCAVYGYNMQQEAKAQRGEVIKLHRQIQQLSEESKAARMEAAKLRAVIEIERKKTEEALKTVTKK